MQGKWREGFELMEGLTQEAAVFKSVFPLWDADVPLEQPGEGRKEGRVVLAELLGELIWEELSDCLIHNCLVNSIPTNSSKLEQYKEVGPKKPLMFEHRAQALQWDGIQWLMPSKTSLLSAFIPNLTLFPDFWRLC